MTVGAGDGSRWSARQRAMLAEMGALPWPAEAVAEGDAVPVAARPAPSHAEAAPLRRTANDRIEANAATGAVRRVDPDVGAGDVSAKVSPAVARAVASAGAGRGGWQALAQEVAACTACGLCRTRRQTVFAAGSPEADLMIVGEAPGADEDARGEPFVGVAGQLLDRMLAAIGRARSGAGQGPGAMAPVCIANVLKCRPPGNRNPQPEEVAQCRPFLLRQIAMVRPRVVLAVGRFAVDVLLRDDAPVGRLRGRVHEAVGLDDLPADVPRPKVVVTYHPAYLLRQPAEKAKAWEDLRRVAALLGRAA